MLTRLRVSGFKNLVDVDVSFGPFTCIAGANAVGKSNLFDAIVFLSALADKTLVEVAADIGKYRADDVRGLFHRVGQRHDDRMSFEAEMIVQQRGTDDLGQEMEATITFLRYSLELGFRKGERPYAFGGFEVLEEGLRQINIGDAVDHLLFPHHKQWRNSIVRGKRARPFISTRVETSGRVDIQLHQDRGESGGRTRLFPASMLPRTVLSSANTAENRTAVLARREMRSWRRIQLEPAKLREPDSYLTRPGLQSDGSHLAATLFHLAAKHPGAEPPRNETPDVYAAIANRLASLITDVREVWIDRDEQREQFTLKTRDRTGTEHSARALSDGTLRFLALAVIHEDPAAQGVLCLEEPENGINPARIPAMLQLLQDIATDANEPVDATNPLRQVIINTHSPVVVGAVPDDSLVIAEARVTASSSGRFQRVCFAPLSGTWRAEKPAAGAQASAVALGTLLGYLSPVPAEGLPSALNGHSRKDRAASPRQRRVIDRPEVQMHLFDLDTK